jgi:hypothetical protein
MDTIAHSTMGDLVVGNYDLNLGQGVSGNAFIYNMSTRQWTLLQLGGEARGQRDHAVWHLAERRPRQPQLHPGPAARSRTVPRRTETCGRS